MRVSKCMTNIFPLLLMFATFLSPGKKSKMFLKGLVNYINI